MSSTWPTSITQQSPVWTSLRGGAGLAIEALLHRRLGEDLGTRDLQGDLDVKLQIQGEIDRPHPATAQPLQEAIAAEVARKRTTWIWCHRRWFPRITTHHIC